MLPVNPDLPPKRPRHTRNAVWVAIGVGVGTAIGVATDNLAVWVAIGAGIGLLLSLFAGTRRSP